MSFWLIYLLISVVISLITVVSVTMYENHKETDESKRFHWKLKDVTVAIGCVALVTVAWPLVLLGIFLSALEA